MKCNECDGRYVKKSGSLQISDRHSGPFTVERIKYHECNQCGDFLFSPQAAKRVEQAREKALDTILQSQPLGAFVPAPVAAGMLGISRQALHKHRRIRRGFIFQTRFGDKAVYLEESVRRFKTTGDGRFALWKTERPAEGESLRRTARTAHGSPKGLSSGGDVQVADET